MKKVQLTVRDVPLEHKRELERLAKIGKRSLNSELLLAIEVHALSRQTVNELRELRRQLEETNRAKPIAPSKRRSRK